LKLKFKKKARNFVSNLLKKYTNNIKKNIIFYTKTHSLIISPYSSYSSSLGSYFNFATKLETPEEKERLLLDGSIILLLIDKGFSMFCLSPINILEKFYLKHRRQIKIFYVSKQLRA